MSLWIPYFAVAIGMFIFAQKVPNASIDCCDECNKLREKDNTKYCLYIVLIILAAFCAFKSISASAVDEYAYRVRFDRYSELNFFEALDYCKGEYLNGILVWFSTRIFDSNQGIFIVFGSLTAYFYWKAINKYSGDYGFAILLLMVGGTINTSFNITQQSLACAIFVCFSDLIYKKKFWKFLLLVLICYLIHNASIILLPLYIFSSERFKSNKGRFYIVLFSIAFIFLYKNLDAISNRIGFLDQYVEMSESGERPGINIITIIINCVPAMLALLYLKRLNKNDLITNLSINMCILHGAIYVAGLFDRYIARLGMFTNPFCVIFLSRSLDLFSNKRSVQYFKLLAVIFYSLELYLRIRGYSFEFNFQF